MASSFDPSAAARSTAIQTSRCFSIAIADRSAKSVRHSDVRPLIQTSAILMPCGLTAQSRAASVAAGADRFAARQSSHNARTHAA